MRHLVATLAYRAANVLRDVPQGFDAATFEPVTRRPVRIVAHMADLMAWALTLARGESVWKAEGGSNWAGHRPYYSVIALAYVNNAALIVTDVPNVPRTAATGWHS